MHTILYTHNIHTLYTLYNTCIYTYTQLYVLIYKYIYIYIPLECEAKKLIISNKICSLTESLIVCALTLVISNQSIYTCICIYV